MKPYFLFFIFLLLDKPFCAAYEGPEKDLPAVADAFYNLDFERALEFVRKVRAQFPDHPAGPFYESIVHYQRMQIEYPRSEETAKLLHKNLEDCVIAAKGMSKEMPAMAHYYMGACYGFEARVYVAAGSYMSAVKMARRGAKHLKKALQLDESIVDAYLGVGMYHYYMDRMPAAAKPFAYLLMGMWGDRELGLKEMERVAQEGGPAKAEALAALASIYAAEEEGAWGKSEEILKDLMERFNANPRFRLLRIYVAQKREDWPLALKLSDTQDGWLSQIAPDYREHTQSLLLYRQAETLTLSGRAKEAERIIKEIEPGADKFGFKDWTLLLSANALDARHEREEALKLYKEIEDSEAKKAAKIFIKTPYPKASGFPRPYQWPLVGLPQE